MKRSQSGFTLIELVVVIVLLGILGVTALGKFQNLSAEAADAAAQGLASELSSAAAINFAADAVGATATAIATADCINTGVTPSATLNALMASGSAPTANYEYAIITGAAGGDITTEGAACGAGQTFKCSVNNTQGTTAGVATIICTG
jgi:prepilin-type N-terminal cleavage/methylation domain-containing protein